MTVELIPFSDPEHPRLLGRATIANDGTGTGDEGNYEVSIETFDPKTGKPQHGYDRTARVTNYPRRRRTIWALLFRAIQAAFPAPSWR